MVTRYSRIEDNAEVMDVLYCIILGHNTVKKLKDILKQPQSTISTKIQFLLKNKVILKNKWEFYSNWNNTYQVMYKILKENSPISLQFYVKSYIRKVFKISDSKVKQLEKVIKNIELYFPEERLKRIVEGYAKLFIQNKEKASIQDIINQYFVGLIGLDKDSIKELDEPLRELYSIMKKVPSKEVEFFKTVELS